MANQEPFKLPSTPEELEALVQHIQQLQHQADEARIAMARERAVVEAAHWDGPGADFLEGRTVELHQAMSEEAEVTVDPWLGYEIRSAEFVDERKLLVVSTARADGFVEAIIFDTPDLPTMVGTTASPVHLFEFDGELRARFTGPRSQGPGQS